MSTIQLLERSAAHTAELDLEWIRMDAWTPVARLTLVQHMEEFFDDSDLAHARVSGRRVEDDSPSF